MTLTPPQLRATVIARARNRCEYCCLPAHLQVGGFEVDHILPRSRGGETALHNLAHACPHCNNQKSDFIEFLDPVSGAVVPLFNPRTQDWDEHFRWSQSRAFEIEGLTACGRATVECLQLNHPQMVGIRRSFTEFGVEVRSRT